MLTGVLKTLIKKLKIDEKLNVNIEIILNV